ncbi:YkgJ family cysteine cluster protein [Helicobacter jaachi]|uniref:YkgJ family cysteine cluster protein n=1 Tax=Helicobacter jaachi TaxID=1677920 RepID=A0A4V6I2N0_9HELI|nr:YkgJ family cysteine cluster protein [Helicobacter jaachi]TLD96742.1 YkgJ family cysteine cluster protein [Helicobacter jaachi]
MSKDSLFPFSFDNSACKDCGGKCCTGESGYVFVSIQEMQDIAQSLQLSFESFTLQFVRKVGYRFSLIEKSYENGLACVFFDTHTRQCGIYAHRPAQCRSFPFWEAHRHLDSKALALLRQECAGIITKQKE